MYPLFITVDFTHKNLKELLSQEIMQIIFSHTDVAICYEYNDWATKFDNSLAGNRT